MKRIPTQRQINRRRKRRIAAVALALLLVASFYSWSNAAKFMMQDESARSLQESIIASANQCYAIEGSYPSSLDYLETNYDLMVDHSEFAITYDVYAENIAPKVTVTPR